MDFEIPKEQLTTVKKGFNDNILKNHSIADTNNDVSIFGIDVVRGGLKEMGFTENTVNAIVNLFDSNKSKSVKDDEINQAIDEMKAMSLKP